MLQFSAAISCSARYMALYLANTLDKVSSRADHLISHSTGTCLDDDLRIIVSLSFEVFSCSKFSSSSFSDSSSSLSSAHAVIKSGMSPSIKCLRRMTFLFGLPPRNHVSVPNDSDKSRIEGTCLQEDAITKYSLCDRQ